MSDIGLNLSGIIAVLIFFWAAVGLALAAVVSILVAFIRGKDGGFKRQGAFAFFLAAVPLIVINLAACGILAYAVDSNERAANEFLDQIAVYAWLPLQPIIWIVLGFTLRKVRKK